MESKNIYFSIDQVIMGKNEYLTIYANGRKAFKLSMQMVAMSFKNLCKWSQSFLTIYANGRKAF
jgi:hypothetical protein